jgi:hypothetical protein
LPFSRDRYASVSKRISAECAPASSEFCSSSRNTVFDQGHVSCLPSGLGRAGLTCEFTRIACQNLVDESSLVHLDRLIVTRCPLSWLGESSTWVPNTPNNDIHVPVLALKKPSFESVFALVTRSQITRVMAIVLPGDDNPAPTHWLDVLLVLTGYRCGRR